MDTKHRAASLQQQSYLFDWVLEVMTTDVNSDLIDITDEDKRHHMPTSYNCDAPTY